MVDGLNVLDRTSDCVVVALRPGYVREGLADLRWRLGELLADGKRSLVLDVTEVDRISSVTVATLLLARRHCHARGGTVVVRNPSRRSLEMLTRTGLSQTFDIDHTTDTTAHTTDTTADHQPATS